MKTWLRMLFEENDKEIEDLRKINEGMKKVRREYIIKSHKSKIAASKIKLK